MIFASDMSIKTMIELGLDDIRKNPWLISDILSDCVTNPYLAEKYGQSQIDSCKEWFLNNQVDIYMAERKDKDRLPCITINLGNSQEKDDMKHMGDQSSEVVKLLPRDINKPIPYVVKPFTTFTYDSSTGIVTIPSTVDLKSVAVGMILVDPATGNGYAILDVASVGILIDQNLTLTATQFAVVPQFQFYQARVEHAFFQETYKIDCHTHGDPQSLLWLHSIVLYSILRYRESLLEANGFGQSSISSSDMYANPAYSGPGGEIAYSRSITLTGMVENTWIKAPKRIIEKVALGNGLNAGFTGGIKILSNFDTAIPDDNSWNTVYDPNAPKTP